MVYVLFVRYHIQSYRTNSVANSSSHVPSSEQRKGYRCPQRAACQPNSLMKGIKRTSGYLLALKVKRIAGYVITSQTFTISTNAASVMSGECDAAGLSIKGSVSKRATQADPTKCEKTPDELFVEEVIRHLRNALSTRCLREDTWGYHNAEEMLEMLEQHSLPAVPGVDVHIGRSETDTLQHNSNGMPEVYPHSDHETESGMAPIQELFGIWMRDDKARLSVSDPSRSIFNSPAVTRTVMKINERFTDASVRVSPWNLLDFSKPHVKSFKPQFFDSWDCSFFKALGAVAMTGRNASRAKASKAQLHSFPGLEEWILVAEAGALTLPHQDSHGYSTWLKALQGEIGFGWLVHPSQADLNAWYQNRLWKNSPDKRAWRYVILRPGQWVHFPSGTVHFVFRRSANNAQTMLAGGHYVRWSAVEQWITVLVNQLYHPAATNEALVDDADSHVRAGCELVKREQEAGNWDLLGGKGALERFWKIRNEEYPKALKYAKEQGKRLAFERKGQNTKNKSNREAVAVLRGGKDRLQAHEAKVNPLKRKRRCLEGSGSDRRGV